MLYGHNTCNELIWFINLNSNLQAKLYFVFHPCWQLISSPCLHLEFDSQTVSRLSFLEKLFTLAHLAAHLAAFFFFLLPFCMLLSMLQLFFGILQPAPLTLCIIAQGDAVSSSQNDQPGCRLHSAPCEWAAAKRQHPWHISTGTMMEHWPLWLKKSDRPTRFSQSGPGLT